jgi:hypothetical protein
MSADVVTFPGITTLDIPPERILDQAQKAGLTEVVVLGYDKDGEEYFSSSIADGAEVIWLLERLKLQLLRLADT